MITQGYIGATPKQAFRATNNGVDAFPNVIYDKQAPFLIGTVGWAVSETAANARVIAQFCRVAGAIGIGGTATVANGVATAGAGTWTNETGVALAAGDYVWLTAGVTPALAADSLAADSPSKGAKVGESEEDRKLREAEEAEYQKAEKERANKKVHA